MQLPTPSNKEFNNKDLPQELFDLLWGINPVPCADVFIVEQSKILLVKRDIPPHIGSWHVPGSRVRKGERIADAAKRSALRETGLEIEIVKYLGYYDDPESDSRGHAISHAFLCKPVGGSLCGSKEGSEIRFFDKIPKNLYFSNHIKALKDLGFK